ncbi:MAG: polysaccharide biosynthesis tyrosine autokinase [Bacteroidota bacterium]
MPYGGPPDPRFSPGAYQRQPNEAKSSLHEILEILRLGKWYIISVTLLVLAAVTVYTFLAEPVYEASAILLIDKDASKINEAGNLPFAKPGLVQNSDIDNQLHYLRNSREIAQHTADRLIELRTLPGSSQPLHVLTMATSSDDLASLLQEEILSFTAGSEGVDAVEITATSNSAAEAAIIANFYAEEYITETADMSREDLTRQRLFLEKQYADKKVELDTIESQLANFMNSGNAVALNDQTQYKVAQIANMQTMLEETRLDLSMRESSLLALEQEIQEILPNLPAVISSTTDKQMGEVQNQITELEMRVEQIYKKNPELRGNPGANPQLKGYHDEIAQQRSKLDALSRQLMKEWEDVGFNQDPSKEGINMNYLATIKRQIVEERVAISGLNARARSTERRLREYDNEVRSIPDKMMALAKLQRDKTSTEELFLILGQRLSEITIAEKSVSGFAKILNPAISPDDPVKPKKAINLIMGLMLGLMMGIGVAVARRKFDTKVYSPDDLNDRDINMLGVVPDMRQLIKKEFGKRLKIDFEGREVSTALSALIAPMSPIAEAYRRLYIKLQFSRDDMGIQNLMVTSPKAGAGKSTTSLNLAFTTAQAGKRTLVVDADLRRPSLHDKLGLPEGPSLLELLSEDESRWDSERFFTGIENVYVITGIPVSQPAELLGSRKMIDLIERFRTEFDIIIFDTPPVLGCVDPVLLSRQCDGVIVVASSDGTDMESLNQTLEELKSVNANILGTVLNRFDPTSMYGYKNTYGYSYGSNSYVAS